MTAPAPRIDMHAHFYGGDLPRLLRARHGRPGLRTRDDGVEVMRAMNGEFPFGPAYHDHGAVLAQMDSVGVTRRLLTFPGALGVDLLPAEEVAGPIAAFNDHLADLRAQTAGRLTGLAGLPMADIGAACAELRRIRRDLRLPGVILPGNYFNSLAEAETLAPLLAAAQETGCHVMIHPGLKVGQEPPAPPADFMQYRTSALDLQSQVAQTALTLVLSDFFARFPAISWQVVNLGGTLPFVFERIEAIARHRNPEAPFPTDRLRHIWYDTASLGPRALEAALALFGPERVMMGSDWPIFYDDAYATALAPARIDEATRAAVAGGNAQRLLEGLEGRW